MARHGRGAGLQDELGDRSALQEPDVHNASLSLLVNYPHFLVSYKLAYSRGRAFITGNWWQLIVVPIGLIGVFGVAFLKYDVPVAELPPVSALSTSLGAWGTNAQVLAGPRLGDLLFGLTFNVMIFTVGWHYTKQVFGCMMVYAYFDRYAMTPALSLIRSRGRFSYAT